MQFIDLKEQYRRYKHEIDAEIGAVLESAHFIMGEPVKELEAALAEHTGARHAIGCSSGTDALLLGLLALDIHPGDEVIVPDFTFFATAEVVAFLGATPVFVDVRPDTLTIDPRPVERAITTKTKGIIPVSLFGQCADIAALNQIARAHRLWVFEDAAQSYGATQNGKRSGSLTPVAAVSFYPAKPLGCYGDGGAVFTDDDALAGTIRQLLNHGQSATYVHARLGINGRLDTMQAAILKVKLRHFDDELAARQVVAARYLERLAGTVTLPVVAPGNTSVWAQFTVRSPHRQKILAHLKTTGIPTAVHYPAPLHRQKPFAGLGADDSFFPESIRASEEVFSLPMHPFLEARDIDLVADAVREASR
jgi:UDP-2-acetamido-2-deoxy-ribo-hexuluronate aminotransferase